MATIKSIGKNIAKVRKNEGFTQERLAHEADIDRSYISDIERGQANLSLGMLLTICTVLKINPKTLFD